MCSADSPLLTDCFHNYSHYSISARTLASKYPNISGSVQLYNSREVQSTWLRCRQWLLCGAGNRSKEAHKLIITNHSYDSYSIVSGKELLSSSLKRKLLTVTSCLGYHPCDVCICCKINQLTGHEITSIIINSWFIWSVNVMSFMTALSTAMK